VQIEHQIKTIKIIVIYRAKDGSIAEKLARLSMTRMGICKFPATADDQ